MKKYLIYVLTIFAVLSVGCGKSWLDVNHDPNNTESATSSQVLPAGIMSVVATTGDYFTLYGGFWAQYWTQSNESNQYKNIDSYNIASTSINTVWNEMYSGGLNDLQFVINKAKESGNNGMLLIATAMQCYGFAFMVDYFGNIPYTEAFQGAANLSPKYDDGKTIYLDLIRRLDSVKALDFSVELTDAEKNSDLVFGGDIDSWIAFINTLELKMYLRMVNNDPTAAENGVRSLYTAGATFLGYDAKINFYDSPNSYNPLYASDKRYLNFKKNLRISTTLYKYYDQNSDPRNNFVCVSTGLSEPQGGFVIPSSQLNPASVIEFKLYPDAPVYIISEVESYLLQAEAIMRTWGTGDAKALYDAAILADFSRKGYDGSAFVNTGGAYEYPSTGNEDQKLEAIIMAKWAAFAGNQAAEAFFDWNRTGYPVISSVPAWVNGAANTSYVGGKLTYSLGGTTNGEFPHRLIYPESEKTLNANFPGQVDITDKVWWSKQ